MPDEDANRDFFKDLFGNSVEEAWASALELGFVTEEVCECDDEECSGTKVGITEKGYAYAASLRNLNVDTEQ
jgi:hypothetical protein